MVTNLRRTFGSSTTNMLWMTWMRLLQILQTKYQVRTRFTSFCRLRRRPYHPFYLRHHRNRM
jgi:hypothetical protein